MLAVFILVSRIRTFSWVSRTCSSSFKLSVGSERLSSFFFFSFPAHSPCSVLLKFLLAGSPLLSLVSASVLGSPGMGGSSSLSFLSHPWALSRVLSLFTGSARMVPSSVIFAPWTPSCSCVFLGFRTVCACFCFMDMLFILFSLGILMMPL